MAGQAGLFSSVVPVVGNYIDYDYRTDGSYQAGFYADLGPPDPDRWIYAVFTFTTGSSRSASSLTINGVSATLVDEQNYLSGGSYAHVQIWKANVPTGNANQYIYWVLSGITGSGNGQAVGIYSLISDTGFTEETEFTETASGSSPTGAVTAGRPTDYYIYGMCTENNGSTTPSTTSDVGTVHFDQDEGDTRHAAISGPNIPAINLTLTGGSPLQTLVGGAAIRKA